MALLDFPVATTSEMRSRGDSAASGSVNEHVPVGIGLPMCVSIETIYTGEAPSKMFGGKPDMIVTSSVKGPATFQAAQRAINQLVPEVKDDQYVELGAHSQGTPIVYYTPALQESELFFSFELCAEKFNRKMLDRMSELFGMAGKMPMFFAAGQALVVGSRIVNFVGKLGKTLFETRPFLSDTMRIRIDIGGFRDFKPGFKLICADKDRSFFADRYELKMQSRLGEDAYRLVERGGTREYRGNRPYLILNVDGRERNALMNFEPKLASAVIISRFFGEDRQESGFELLEDALQLKNDLSYLKKIKEYRHRMSHLEVGSEDHERLSKFVAAYEKNIMDEELRGVVARLHSEDENT